MGKPASQGEHSHPTPAHTSPAPTPKKGAKSEAVAGMCNAVSCKSKSHKFNFCDEHFQQFKFGLITKEGSYALDYERKFDHYQAFKKKSQKSSKVA